MDYRKIYGGTPAGDESRCDTCAHAHIVKGYAASERITMCDFSYPPLHIPFKVCECSDYMDKRLPDVEDMEKIAVDLTWVKPSRPAGFKNSQACEVSPGPVNEDEDEAA